MIDYIDIVVNPSSMTKSKYNSITGEIYFQIGNKMFPEENWSDFIVVVLSWWLNSIKDVYELRNSNFEMSFMDGPLVVKGTRKTDEVLELSFVKNCTDSDDILFSINCTIENLKKSLLIATRKILKEIENREWETPDIVALKNATHYFKTKSF